MEVLREFAPGGSISKGVLMPFQIVRNDITKMHVDAIVNTANPVPGYGAGTDAAVYEAAGAERLLAKRQEIGEIERGHSAITDGYDLPAKYIIHTVGTAWQGGSYGEEAVIRDCYRSVFALAVENGIGSLAIPLLASGSYGFPKGIALRIALSEIEAFMADHDIELYLVVFDEKAFALSSELYGDIDAYINDNYVEEKARAEYRHPGSNRPVPDMAPMASAMSVAGSASKPRGLGAGLSDIISGIRTKDKKGGKAKASREDVMYAQSLCEEAEPEYAAEYADETCDEPGLGGSICAESGLGGSICVAPADEDVAEYADAICAAPVDEIYAAPRESQKSLEDVVNNLDKTFMEMVFSFADEKGMTDVEVQKRANLDRKAFSKLKCGTTKNPSKGTALALAVALMLNLDDTKDLLSRAGFALSPCSKQDLIVQYFIERKAYDIYAINVALFEHGEPLLGTQAS